jgi:hypothetical protein
MFPVYGRNVMPAKENPADAEPRRQQAGRAMQRLVALALLSLAFTACQPKMPTEKELLELRSQCAALADKWEKAREAAHAHFVVRSHYDLAGTRCLLRAERSTDRGSEPLLLDAQTLVLLAGCNPTFKDRCEIEGEYDVTHQQVLDYIDSRMGDDR